MNAASASYAITSNGLSLYPTALVRPHTTEGIVRVQNPPLNYVDEFMKVDRLIS